MKIKIDALESKTKELELEKKEFSQEVTIYIYTYI